MEPEATLPAAARIASPAINDNRAVVLAGRRRFVCWLPLAGSLTVAATFAVLQFALHFNQIDLDVTGASASVPTLSLSASILGARTAWGTAILLSVVIMLGLFAGAVWMLHAAATSRILRLWAFLLVTVNGLAFGVFPDVCMPGLQQEEAQLIARNSDFDPSVPLQVFLSCLFSTGVAVAFAVSIQIESVFRDPALDNIRRVNRLGSALLRVAVVWLVIGVVGISLFHQMAGMFIATEAKAGFEELATASTVLTGAFYSALLAAMFGPMQLTLREAARTLAPSSANRSERALNRWLAQQGFAITRTQELRGALAVLAPLLATIVQELIKLRPS